eukprot:198478_1
MVLVEDLERRLIFALDDLVFETVLELVLETVFKEFRITFANIFSDDSPDINCGFWRRVRAVRFGLAAACLSNDISIDRGDFENNFRYNAGLFGLFWCCKIEERLMVGGG